MLPSVSQAPQLPAHLQEFGALTGLNESITGGIFSGGHPRINVKGSKWRLQKGADEELVNSLTLNVVVVDANKTLSKVFYANKYNPKDDDEKAAPDCSSDNGQGPSSRAPNPQSVSCATCPHNVWGSRVTEQGNKTKACADYKKLAVILADDPKSVVYELRIPPASLQDLNKIMSKLTNHGVPIPTLVFELSFDPNVDYPKVVFKPLCYIDAAQAERVKQFLNSDEAKEAVGSNDKPIAALPAPGGQQAAPAPLSKTTAYNPAPPQAPVYHQAPSTPVHTKAAPQGVVQDPLDIPQFLQRPQQEQTAQEEPRAGGRGRGRPRKEEQVQTAGPASAQLSLDMPGMQPAAQATQIKPQATDDQLEALLAGVLK